ncbi:bifunctional biotin--[acetyl-CoA-carboxylase] ligase/biotin operon repressor BirA [Ectopseudomonas mendocina]|uniref:Bifunctional ligase/repressor BirA n=1 Tax=Ectopseudomonas mendocina TaxID=300 RepID=A0ABZ2RI70_ECTME
MLALLKLLEDGQFHSGEELGAALGVSRAAVWKQLKTLQTELAVPLHSIKGRGYRLAYPMRLLDEAVLNDHAVWPAHVRTTVGSTNAEAMRLLVEKGESPFYVVSEQQTHGRGRRGREWVSPFGQNIYYSLVIPIDGGMRQLEGLSLVVALALLRLVRELGLNSAGLKWPNDLLIGNKKLSGILLELSGDPADLCHVVIGIGLNVNMLPSESEGIGQPWTSLRSELGAPLDRNELILSLNKHLAYYLERQMKGGFSSLREEWEEHHLWQGRLVSLTSGADPIEGVVLGVGSSGAIKLSIDGVERSFSGGELSLRLRDDS